MCIYHRKWILLMSQGYIGGFKSNRWSTRYSSLWICVAWKTAWGLRNRDPTSDFLLEIRRQGGPPTIYKGSYGGLYKWVTGVINTYLDIYITPFITGRGPPCMWCVQRFSFKLYHPCRQWSNLRSVCVWRGLKQTQVARRCIFGVVILQLHVSTQGSTRTSTTDVFDNISCRHISTQAVVNSFEILGHEPFRKLYNWCCAHPKRYWALLMFRETYSEHDHSGRSWSKNLGQGGHLPPKVTKPLMLRGFNYIIPYTQNYHFTLKIGLFAPKGCFPQPTLFKGETVYPG